MKTVLFVALTVLASACAPRYAVKVAPENQPQPVSLNGHTLVAVGKDGSIVWYLKPEEVVLTLLRQISAAAKADADALAAEGKTREKCEADRSVLLKLTGIKSLDPVPAPAPAAASPTPAEKK